ncbi:hypothetical protein ACOESC_001031 [Salmonella enterica]
MKTETYELIDTGDDQYYRVGNCLLYSRYGDWEVITICEKPKTIKLDDFHQAYALAIYLNEKNKSV